jgi:O-antigen ligase
MSDLTSPITQAPGLLRQVASWPRSRFWLTWADIYPTLCAAALPWSTTAVSFLTVIWFITASLAIEPARLRATLRRPAALLPLLFVALALVGTLWTDDTWWVRLQGLSPVIKLLAIPLLIDQFERSGRGHWTFIAFVASCSLLMGLSWLDYLAPGLNMAADKAPGVPVRNYIDQSQEFGLAIFGLAPLLLMFIRKRQIGLAVACGALLAGFLANMAFVVVARTAFIFMPVLVVAFAFRFLNPKVRNIALVVAVGLSALAMAASPYLRYRVERTIYDYKLNQNTNIATSYGERLFYWRSSIKSIEEAPLFGHGTGSTKQVFEREADGKSGEWANVVRNPHNQTLYVAVQWGLLGVILLWAMWYYHLTLFLDRTLVSWIGLIVVAQNIVSSLLNSHLFDFHEGWLYVLGVGAAGGMVLAERKPKPSTESPAVPRPQG